MNKKLFSAMVSLIVALMAVSCKQDPVSPDTDQKVYQDTSIFLGTWNEIFDTTDIPVGWGPDKISFWYSGGGFIAPDTLTFVDDTLMRHESTGFESNYYYDKDSIYIYNITEGKTAAVSFGYYKKNDTLIFNPDPTKYVPVYKKVQ